MIFKFQKHVLLLLLLLFFNQSKSNSQNPGYPTNDEYNGIIKVYQTGDIYNILKLNYSISYCLNSVAPLHGDFPDKFYLDEVGILMTPRYIDNLYMYNIRSVIKSGIQIGFISDYQLSRKLHSLLGVYLLFGDYKNTYSLEDEDFPDFHYDLSSQYEWNSLLVNLGLRYDIISSYYCDVYISFGGYAEYMMTHNKLPIKFQPGYLFWPHIDKFSESVFYGFQIGAGCEFYVFGKKISGNINYRRGLSAINRYAIKKYSSIDFTTNITNETLLFQFII